MKKILIFIMCMVTALTILTGCEKEKTEKNNDLDNNVQENVEHNENDKGEELIYQFDKYIQEKDAEKMAGLFNEKYTNVVNTEYFNKTELTDKFKKAFENESYKSYKVTNVHKITSKEDFNKYYKEAATLNYDYSILRTAQIYGDNTLVFVADVEYNSVASQDIFYISNIKDQCVIERTVLWSFLIN